jgi:2-furoate---CoA ligase
MSESVILYRKGGGANMDLARMFEFAVGRCPHGVALVEGEREFTFVDLNQEVNRLANSLRKLGIGRKDRVMVLLKNRRQTVCSFWAIQKLGAIFTPVNYHMSVKDIQHCIYDIEPKAIFFESSTRASIGKLKLDDRPILISLDQNDGDITYDELIRNGRDDFEPAIVDDSDIAMILYTSGTSGVPKGVPRSHKNEYSSTLAHIIHNHYDTCDSMLGVMPLYHTMGVHSLVAMALLNAKYVVIQDFDPELILQALTREKITCLYMMPTMYHELVRHRRIEDYDLSSLKKIGYAGAPMSDALTEDCFRTLKPQLFVNHYGSTEIHTYTTCSYLDKKPGCAGKPGINQLLRLVALNSDSVEAEVERGQVGQVVAHINSAEAFKGYWNRPEVTRDVIKGDWYLTGDLGVLDEDGDLYVVGRVDEMVISGLQHVSPSKVEAILCTHPKILEAAVVGEKDERWGQIVSAYVVSRDDTLTPQELDRYCKLNGNLSNFERPRKYVFLKNLPKTPNGKILRKELTNMSDS